MPSTFHRAKLRRIERKAVTDAGSINLVPLVDILTSIVFFSLLTYTGAAMAMLTSFDLILPPTVVTAEPPGANAPQPPELNLLLAVRITNGNLRVEHSEEDGFRADIPGGITDQSLEQFQALMSEIRQKYPQNNQVLVVPDDGVQYDAIVKVLDRIRLANFRGIALGSRARATETAAAQGGR